MLCVVLLFSRRIRGAALSHGRIFDEAEEVAGGAIEEWCKLEIMCVCVATMAQSV